MRNIFSASAVDHRFAEPGAGAIRSSRRALLFGLLSAASISLAGAVAWTLAQLLGRSHPTQFQFPAMFVATTTLLLIGSVVMSRAWAAVRRERQTLFRRRLLIGLGVGSLFMGCQSFALWTILPAERSAEAASAGAAPFVVMLAALHGMHFLVANLFLSFVTTQALAHRYDHEYHWGVTVCMWFWHALGIVWMAILAVYAIVLTR